MCLAKVLFLSKMHVCTSPPHSNISVCEALEYITTCYKHIITHTNNVNTKYSLCLEELVHGAIFDNGQCVVSFEQWNRCSCHLRITVNFIDTKSMRISFTLKEYCIWRDFAHSWAFINPSAIIAVNKTMITLTSFL